MITSNVVGTTGGINTASTSRNTGGGDSRAALRHGRRRGGGGWWRRPGGGGARQGDGTGSGWRRRWRHRRDGGGTLQRGGSGKASRSIEEIKLVFERNKGSIYAIYNRALREEPALQGKVVFEADDRAVGHVTTFASSRAS
jgi:hypothetical protein